MNIEKDEYNVIPFADMFNHSSNVEVRLYQAIRFRLAQISENIRI
jgi:hypothetical protein